MLELPRFGEPVTVTRTAQLETRLQALLHSLPEIEGAAVVSPDGLAIASVLAEGIEEDRVAAMSAAMVSLGERIARELGRGQMEQVYVRGRLGHAVLTAAGPQAVLTVMARSDVRLGMLLLELRQAVTDLQVDL